MAKPNVIFILSDQHNAKVLGYTGHPNVKTPNLDKMAANGVRFDNAITQNPICTPSRVSWLSGQYCHNHGYYGLSGKKPEGLPTLLGYFRQHGYTTAAIGKIHCPEYWVEDDCDVFHDTCGCSIDGRSQKYNDFLKERGKENMEDHDGLPDFGQRGIQSMEGCPSKLTYEESQEGWSVSETIGFMKNAIDKNQPFFAHVSFPRPHQCTAPSEPFWSMYEDEDLQLPPNTNYDMKGKAPHMQHAAEIWRKGQWALFEPKTFEAARLRKLRGYLGAISQVDHAVGQILQALEDMNITDNTIVIYSSDHGDYACEHDIMEKAPGICSDAITRIPMIWQWRGCLKSGHVAEEIVETVDMSQTLCSLCGLEPIETSDGCDISHLLKGGSGQVHRIGVTEFALSKSVRKGKYRLVYYPRSMFADEYPDGFGELYDLAADPWEMKNLYFDDKYQGVVKDIQNELTEWLITTARPVTVHPPMNSEKIKQGVSRYHNMVNYDGKVPYQKLTELSKESPNYL